MMKPADSSSGAVLVPCLCANYSVWQISLWDHIIPDKEHANLQLEVKSKYPLIDQVKFFLPFLHLGLLLHCNRMLTAEFFLTIICNSPHQGSSLRGKKVQLVLHWYVMPNAGTMIQDRMALSEFKLPDAYTS